MAISLARGDALGPESSLDRRTIAASLGIRPGEWIEYGANRASAGSARSRLYLCARGRLGSAGRGRPARLRTTTCSIALPTGAILRNASCVVAAEPLTQGARSTEQIGERGAHDEASSPRQLVEAAAASVTQRLESGRPFLPLRDEC